MNKDILLNIVSNNMDKISSLTEELCYIDNNKKDRFLKEIEVAGLFSTNLWIQNNIDVSNYEEFIMRIKTYQEILLDNRYIEGSNKLKEVGNITLYLEKGIEYSKNMDNLDNIDILFHEGIRYIKELLQDKEIINKERNCHIKLFSNNIDNYNKIDILRTILINQECLINLEKIMNSFIDEDNKSKII